MADPPAALYLFPAGGQRGTTVKFHAGGLYLNQFCPLEMIGRGVEASPVVRRVESPWFEGPLLPLPESQRQEDYPRAMAGTAKIAADATAGDRYLLLRTAQGVTAPLRFVVGTFPEVVEDEIDGEPVAVPVAASVTINGRIFPHEDVDVWAVTLKKGQTLTALVDAGRIGSPLQAKLELRDPTGNPVAEAVAAGRDPRARVTAPADGVYHVHISDVRADGGPAFVYRLTLATGPVDVPLDGQLHVDDLPEVREADTPDPIRGNFLAVPALGSGRIAAPGEADRWGFSSRKGDALEIELRAARLGSPLLGVLTITDSNSKELTKVEVGATADPSVRFTSPADGLYFATVRDRFRSRGGPDFAYRLRITRSEPGFDLRLQTLGVTVTRGQTTPLRVIARRHGSFTGPIFLNIDGLPAGVTASKDIVIPANQPQVDVPLKADTTARVQGVQLTVRGTGMLSLAPFTAAFVPVTRTATWVDDPAVDRARLAVAVATPFKIAGNYELRLVPRGTVYSRQYRIERNGFTGPIEIELADKQARHLQGATGPRFVVPSDKSEFDYPVTLPPWMEAGRTCRVCVMGTATVKDADGTEHVVTYSSREQNDQVIAVVEPERLGLRLDRPTVLVEPGRSAEVKLDVRRGEKLTGVATVDVLVPRSVKGVSTEPVRIASDAETGSLTLRFAADARGPFPAPLTVRATVIQDGKPVTTERKLELVAPK